MNLAFDFARERRWWKVPRTDPRALALVDGTGTFSELGPHYSRQTVGAAEFMANGRPLVLLTEDGNAVWGAIENRDPAMGLRWRCSIFRNEGAGLSSDLIREATLVTYEYWERHYGGRPPVPLQTEVNPDKTRRKRDPGRCFVRAGWRVVDHRRGLVILEAPP